MVDHSIDHEAQERMARVARQLRETERVSNPGVVTEARRLVSQIRRGTADAAVLHKLAAIIEREERRYQELVGDPYLQNQRGIYTIGKVLNLVKLDDEEDLDDLAWHFLTDRNADPALRAATARLALSVLFCTGYQHPMDDENTMKRVHDWAVGDQSNKDLQGLEGRRLKTYSTGLLAIALTSDEAAGQLVLPSHRPGFPIPDIRHRH
ncbi:hypothetical protein CYMTET_20001 [Cymbomonas tetramitiformis]|uniref:Uncharacterized protein n=1 Tax=Cymbomonas tetramitiformis TaxID=36881 RepID=A0AAE0G5K2_9CHLO|nr:hypothetical protein CYMTET_20001 [Cymbomonas tetramitiformis]